MKKMLVIMIAMVLVSGAFAQKGVHRGGVKVVRVRPVMSWRATVPYFAYNPFWGMPYYGYPYYAYPYAYNYGYNRPTKLDLQIADIRNDFQQKISAARSDKTISRSERRKAVRDLKHERNQDIIAAKRSYYKLS
ncbi:MAG: hypothetical protein JST63_11365 [Bacteroidetes bacterium]|nr:hypothetical protein [Bacteroidota bacterium]